MPTGELVKHAREAIGDSGQDVDNAVFDRLARRMSYLHVTDPASTAASPRGSAAQSDRCTTALFGPIVELLGAARLLRGGRVAIEKPFGHDLASARELNASLRRLLPESLPKVTGERLYQNMRLNLPNRRGG